MTRMILDDIEKKGWALPTLLLFSLSWFGGVPAGSAAWEDVQARIDADVVANRPLVSHVIVALCDNVHQGIVKVPEHLGNGDDLDGNLYWGAMYGVRTFLPRSA